MNLIDRLAYLFGGSRVIEESELGLRLGDDFVQTMQMAQSHHENAVMLSEALLIVRELTQDDCNLHVVGTKVSNLKNLVEAAKQQRRDRGNQQKDDRGPKGIQNDRGTSWSGNKPTH